MLVGLAMAALEKFACDCAPLAFLKWSAERPQGGSAQYPGLSKGRWSAAAALMILGGHQWRAARWARQSDQSARWSLPPARVDGYQPVQLTEHDGSKEQVPLDAIWGNANQRISRTHHLNTEDNAA
jgi:hypothetical protein